MKLTVSVEYRTSWGQELFMRMGNKLIPMEYTPGDIWTGTVGRLKEGQCVEYRYELHQGGVCIRTEWQSHRLTVGHSDMKVRDSWSDVPPGLPFCSAPFKDGVFSTVPGRIWRAAGTAVPVFSLRSEKSFGVGEFSDLKLLVDWAALTGQKVIQLLPVNDTNMTGTWEDSYPYSANSSFALHPQFINLTAAGVEADDEFEQLQKELNALPKVDYERVNKEKIRLLRKVYEASGRKVLSSAAYKKFFAANASWLTPYSAFCVLRDECGSADPKSFGPLAVYDEEKVSEYITSHKKDYGFWCFVQYHLHIQLLEARTYAHSKGIIFKGDLPIGVSRTSADAWVNSRLFNLDSQAGAPPDAFSADGQNWGFPTYNWDEMAKDGYAWWKARLSKMSEYFDAFRIDHILGFFRIWEIPMPAKSGLMGHFSPALPYSAGELASLGFKMPEGRRTKAELVDSDVLFVEDPRRKGMWHPRIAAQYTEAYARLDEGRRGAFDRLYDDFFYRRHNSFWKESAMRKLSALLSATGMLACGEDLGMIPDCVPEVMREYQILSLEIQRMPKNPQEAFADPAHYPYLSVCTTSTHDMNPIRAWWEEDRELTGRYWREVLGGTGEAPFYCEPWICRRIAEAHLASPAMLTVLPLQDWLAIDGDLRYSDPAEERINIPAIPRYYWRYRMHLTLENLISQTEFNTLVRGMISGSGR